MLESRYRGDGSGPTLTVLLVAAPIASLFLLGKLSGGRSDVEMSGLVADALVLGAGVAIYVHWRITAGRPLSTPIEARLTGWLAAGLVVTSLHGLVVAVTTASVDATTAGWSMVNQVVLLAVLAAMAGLAQKVDLPWDPALVGFVVGGTLALIHSASLTLAPAWTPTPVATSALNTLVVLVGLGLALVVLSMGQLSAWVRRRVAFAVVMLIGALSATNLTGDHPHLLTIAVVANVAGSIVLCTMTRDLLLSSTAIYHDELDGLRRSLDQARAGSQEDRELLHEVGSTVAGIASASRMMSHGPGLAPVRRERLEAMLAAEVARLQRLMSARAPSKYVDHELDQVVEPLVVSHLARGRDVRWTPSGLSAFADPDDVAEVVNILLENAARHGAGPVVLNAQSDGDDVEITCSDSGPGVPTELREDLFTTGVRGRDSEGQGFGLGIARRLVTDSGGSLELATSHHPGATFVVRLPRFEVSRGEATHVA